MIKNEIVEVSFRFALLIIEYVELLENKKKYVIAKQLLLSGTSVGANIREAQIAESKADFIHKFKIANKEALETQYRLDLSKESKYYPNPSSDLESKLLSIIKLLNKIISSLKINNHEKNI